MNENLSQGRSANVHCGKVEVPLHRIRAVKLNEMKNDVGSDVFEVRTRSGSLIHAQSVKSKGLKLIIRDNSRYYLNVYAGEVLNFSKIKN